MINVLNLSLYKKKYMLSTVHNFVMPQMKKFHVQK
jgi:hypothetical protein